MRPRVLGFVLAAIGFAGMFLAGYIFVTGSGGRAHLFEVTCYLIAGAACFFAGINYIYEAKNKFTEDNLDLAPDLEEIPPIQQQWRTVHVSSSRNATPAMGSMMAAGSVSESQSA